MRKVYFLIPILLTIVFGLYYGQYIKEARILEHKRMVEKERLDKEEEARRTAFLLEEQKRLKFESDQKIAKEKEKRERNKAEIAAREKLEMDLKKAVDDREIKANELANLQNQLKDEEDLNYRLSERIKRLKEEADFLKDYVPTSKANLNKLQSFLTKVEEWEKAQASAAAASAANASKP